VEFEQRKEGLRRPPRYTLEHLYFSREREADVEEVIATINSQQLNAEQARQYSSPFLPGYRFNRQSPDQLARHFGAAFVLNLEQSNPQPNSWVGPIQSTYGLHYVWVGEIEAARDATLEEVRLQLSRDLESRNRAEALREAVAALRQDYEVRI
jgi:hypothetical protein